MWVDLAVGEILLASVFLGISGLWGHEVFGVL